MHLASFWNWGLLELGSGLAHSFRIFLGSQKLSCFLTFPCPVSVPKSCVIFIVSNIESRASQVGLHEQKKDTASAKKEKVSLLRRGGTKTRMCGKNLTAPGRRLRGVITWDRDELRQVRICNFCSRLHETGTKRFVAYMRQVQTQKQEILGAV